MEDVLSFEESNDRVGNYIVCDVLGEGQFATVKSCRKKQFVQDEQGFKGIDDGSQLFALKIINKEKISTINSIRRYSFNSIVSFIPLITFHYPKKVHKLTLNLLHCIALLFSLLLFLFFFFWK